MLSFILIYITISFGIWYILYNTQILPNIELKSDPSQNASASTLFFTFAGAESLNKSNKEAIQRNRIGIIGCLIAPFIILKLIKMIFKTGLRGGALLAIPEFPATLLISLIGIEGIKAIILGIAFLVPISFFKNLVTKSSNTRPANTVQAVGSSAQNPDQVSDQSAQI